MEYRRLGFWRWTWKYDRGFYVLLVSVIILLGTMASLLVTRH